MNLTAEWSLYRKVKSLDPTASTFDGLSSYEGRRENLRGLIQRLGPEITYTVTAGKRITLAMQWSKTYEKDWE